MIKRSEKKWFAFNQATDGPAEIRIFDEIGEWGVTGKSFCEELSRIRGDEIAVRINSPGGDVFAAFSIFDNLRQHPARVNVFIEGLAASAASVIAMAGDSIQMTENSFVMIHEPWGMVVGDAKTMRKQAELLDKIHTSIVNAYSERSGQRVEQIKAWMDAETWFTAEEAKAAGFCDTITGQVDSKKFNLAAKYKKAPACLHEAEKAVVESIRELEAMLRDELSLSHAQAKKLASGGWPALARDVSDADIDEVRDFIRELKSNL